MACIHLRFKSVPYFCLFWKLYVYAFLSIRNRFSAKAWLVLASRRVVLDATVIEVFVVFRVELASKSYLADCLCQKASPEDDLHSASMYLFQKRLLRPRIYRHHPAQEQV
eukprot:m.190458 g.190458  ORF g.190458 m.190458 type:complete len:110 (+) comp16757_c0_seq5:3693-4022(+)